MKNKKEKKKFKPFIIITSIIIILGIIFSVLYFTGAFNKYGKFHGNFQPGQMQKGSQMENFKLNESQINEVTSFFNSNPSSTSLDDYCKTNRGSCFYYCRDINSNDENCKQIMNFSGMNPPRGEVPQ
jgi:hypothetical protein